MKSGFALLVVAICLVPRLQASSDAASYGKDLIEQASAKMDIFALPSFRLTADVRIENSGKMLDGTYALVWNGPEQWREEVAFPGYKEVQVGGKETIYVKRNTGPMPYRVFQMHSALGFGSLVLPRTSFFNQGPHVGERIKSVHKKKFAGESSECVEILAESKYSREVCVSSKTGTLIRAEQHLIGADYSAIGEKLFPRLLVLEQDGQRVVEVHVTELKLGERLESSFFEPPQASLSRPGCMNPVPGPKLKEVFPVYPFEDKKSRNHGIVGIYAIIDENGAPKELQKVKSASPGLDMSASDAIAKWRYAPATCDGKPVAVETVLEVIYTLQYSAP